MRAPASFQLLSIVLLALVSSCCSLERLQAPCSSGYSLGNFAYTPPPTFPTVSQKICNACARYVRMGIFCYCTRGAVTSIMEDSWEAIRDPSRVESIKDEHERRIVKRRVWHAEKLRSLVGAGYTPRLVWLFGLMLRGIIQCTALPQILNPPIGFGAGAVAAARFAHREWLPCIMLGWYGGGFYWKQLFGVNGPPSGFDGVRIQIRQVRM